jgi:hypothetical protein
MFELRETIIALLRILPKYVTYYNGVRTHLPAA